MTEFEPRGKFRVIKGGGPPDLAARLLIIQDTKLMCDALAPIAERSKVARDIRDMNLRRLERLLTTTLPPEDPPPGPSVA